VHDYFDIVGVPGDAPAAEIRRACGRRVRSCHPDISGGDGRLGPAGRHPRPEGGVAFSTADSEAAVDFVDMAVFVDRMVEHFFATCGSTSTR
jgi:curved DNA-binding protein CbpA